MKRLLKKLHKAVTVVMCVALVFETVNLTGLTVSAGESTSVSGNSVSGNAISEATQSRLDSLKRSAQTADTYAGKTETQWNAAKLNLQRIEAAVGINDTLYKTTFPKVSTFAKQAQGSLERAKAAYETALENMTKWQSFFEGEGVLDQAKNYVEVAKEAAARAQLVFGENVDPAAKVDEVIVAAQGAFDSKKVVATFFVLKDSTMFESLHDFGNPNRYYVEVGQGELVDHNEASPEPYSLLDDYASKSVAIKTDLDRYIVESSIPSREAIKAALEHNGIALADSEEVVWYIIKTESGIIHIDGVIREITEGNTPAPGGEEGGNPPAPGGEEGGNTPAPGGEEGGNTPAPGGEEGGNTPAPGGEEGGNTPAPGGEEGGNTPTPGGEEGGNTPAPGGEEGGNTPAPGGEEGGNTPAPGGEEGGNTSVPGGEERENSPMEETQGNTSGAGVQNPTTPSANTTVNEGTTTPVQEAAPATSVLTVAPAAPIAGQNAEDMNDAEMADITDDEAAVIIEDETTALASGIQEDVSNSEEATSDEVITIEEEETPLAAGRHCWVHWVILILTLVYTILELLFCIRRNKKINELKEELEEENAVV